MDVETIREFVGDIGNEAERLNRMSHKLLTLSRVDSEDNSNFEIIYITPTIERVVRMLSAVANENKITLTQDDLTKAVMQEARRYPGQEKIVFEYYQKNPQALDALKAPLFEEKVVDYVLTVVKINEENLSADELYAYNPDAPKK